MKPHIAYRRMDNPKCIALCSERVWLSCDRNVTHI